jgi:hypothetical protein
MALIEGQKQVGLSLKDALSGVGELLKKTEQKYIEENTFNLQQKLKDSILAGGLGQDAPDLANIKHEYGKLADMGALEKTVTDTRNKLMSAAADTAHLTAMTTLDQTRDITAAGSAFRKSLLEAGIKPEQANVLESQWRQNNAFRGEDIVKQDARTMTEKLTESLDTYRRAGGSLSAEEIDQNIAESVPSYLQGEFKQKAKDLRVKEGALNQTQENELKYVDQTFLNQKQRAKIEGDSRLAVAKTQLDRSAIVPKEIYEGTGKFIAELGGVGAAVDKQLNGRWFAFGDSNLNGESAVKAIYSMRNQLINSGVPQTDADAIIHAAYAEAKLPGIGDTYSLDGGRFKKAAANYFARYPVYAKAMADYNEVAKQEQERLLNLDKQHADTLFEYRNKYQEGNLLGKATSLTNQFKDSLSRADFEKADPKEITARVNKAALGNDLDPKMVQTFIQLESGGDVGAINKETGAKGVLQLLGPAAKDMDVVGKEFDVDLVVSRMPIKIKNDAAELMKVGEDPTGPNLYLAWQQGGRGAAEIFASAKTGKPLSEARLQNMKANLPSNLKNTDTATDPAKYIAYWQERYGMVEAQVGQSNLMDAAATPPAGGGKGDITLDELTGKLGGGATGGIPELGGLNSAPDVPAPAAAPPAVGAVTAGPRKEESGDEFLAKIWGRMKKSVQTDPAIVEQRLAPDVNKRADLLVKQSPAEQQQAIDEAMQVNPVFGEMLAKAIAARLKA